MNLASIFSSFFISACATISPNVFIIDLGVKVSEDSNPEIYIKSPNQKTFEIEVKIDDHSFPTGMGLDKKSAEQTAAKIALEQMDAPF